MYVTQTEIIHSKTRVDMHGSAVTYVESWQIPNDFSDAEINLLKEMLIEGVLSPRESYQCIRALR